MRKAGPGKLTSHSCTLSASACYLDINMHLLTSKAFHVPYLLATTHMYRLMAQHDSTWRCFTLYSKLHRHHAPFTCVCMDQHRLVLGGSVARQCVDVSRGSLFIRLHEYLVPFLLHNICHTSLLHSETIFLVTRAGPALLPAPDQLAAMQSCMRLQLLTLIPAMGMQLGHQPILQCQVLPSSRQSNMPPWRLRQVRLGITT